MFIKNFFAVLAFILLTVSSAQADYLGDLCDDLYQQIEDQSIGSTMTQQFYADKVLPEVQKMIAAEIEAEMVAFFSTGAGKDIRTSGKSKKQKITMYLRHKKSYEKAHLIARGLISEYDTDESGKVKVTKIRVPKPGMTTASQLSDRNNFDIQEIPLTRIKIARMTGGEKLRAFFLVYIRYLEQTYAMYEGTNTQDGIANFNRYKNKLRKTVTIKLLESFPKGEDILKYISQ
jgi:hypothetical protein